MLNLRFFLEVCKFDFEDGIKGWQKTGTAFNNQPTYGDNPTARGFHSPANQQGDWWIGGFEYRPSEETSPGLYQGDEPQGTLTSPPFTIIGKNISFLIGGACNESFSRAELIVKSLVSTLVENCKTITLIKLKVAQNSFQRFSRLTWVIITTAISVDDYCVMVSKNSPIITAQI